MRRAAGVLVLAAGSAFALGVAYAAGETAGYNDAMDADAGWEDLPCEHAFIEGEANCAICGLHASVVEGGALSPEAITAKLREGLAVNIGPMPI